MSIVKCSNGHFYNNEESSACPYCSPNGAMGKTIPLGGPAPAGGMTPPPPAYGRTVMPGAAPANKPAGATVMLDDIGTITPGGSDIPKTSFVSNSEYGATVFMDNVKNSDVKPVRGWIVVIEGEKRGKDFRIHAGRNTVGRSSKNDICFDFDQTISQENACVIAYDDRSNGFFIEAGESTNLIYINGKALRRDSDLFDNDIIEIGSTKLVFRSLCNESFNY